jgi:hypothetical protein
MFCARQGDEVVAALSDQLQREVKTEAVDLGDVLPEQREGTATDAEFSRPRCGRCEQMPFSWQAS